MARVLTSPCLPNQLVKAAPIVEVSCRHLTTALSIWTSKEDEAAAHLIRRGEDTLPPQLVPARHVARVHHHGAGGGQDILSAFSIQGRHLGKLRTERKVLASRTLPRLLLSCILQGKQPGKRSFLAYLHFY